MQSYYNEFVLKRHEANPIITPKDFPGAYAIFNPGQTIYNGQILLLLPIGHNGGINKKNGQVPFKGHVATSDNGVDFKIEPEPLFTPSMEYPYDQVTEQCIDFRVTKIEDTYYIIHPGCGAWGTMAILSKTSDFKTRENVDIISLPDNRIPCLFPEKIDGCYVRLDRPYRVMPNDFHRAGNIWVSTSPDLVHWGHHRPLLQPGFSHWAMTKVGPTPPIKTNDGWLVIIHGVSRSCTGHRYCIGAMLLDLKNPEKIIGLTKSSILAPQEPYEFKGIVPNVVFPAGSVANFKEDEIMVYYGCADTYVGLATGSLSELIDLCKKELNS
jgi:beta-1,4-mannooligosaccharide/beta-1,4-mannosyl-N-acetylglucosamine phosphorylase